MTESVKQKECDHSRLFFFNVMKLITLTNRIS